MESHFDGLTPSQTIGPFFHGALIEERRLAADGAAGDRISVAIRLIDATGAPVSDGFVEVWQADAAGIYPHPEDERGGRADSSFRNHGRSAVDADGWCVFETVLPGPVPGPDGTMQAPHLSVYVFARGLLRGLATRLYFDGDAANTVDPVLTMVSEHRAHTLLARQNASDPSTWSFQIRLSGEDETVFFDV